MEAEKEFTIESDETISDVVRPTMRLAFGKDYNWAGVRILGPDGDDAFVLAVSMDELHRPVVTIETGPVIHRKLVLSRGEWISSISG